MANRQHSLVSLPPAPPEGQIALLFAVEEVLGRTTELARRLTRAIASDELADLLKAQSVFEALPAEQRLRIAAEARRVVVDGARERPDGASDNIVYLRPSRPR
jgi:hypothetical protein